mmetsp:Transcript_41654/g.71309  ORF Transcript_41654/g.71309 Transcript_41654/m.71309 type:complete len:236 (+) Transcript_41654:545-1252(+)
MPLLHKTVHRLLVIRTVMHIQIPHALEARPARSLPLQMTAKVIEAVGILLVGTLATPVERGNLRIGLGPPPLVGTVTLFHERRLRLGGGDLESIVEALDAGVAVVAGAFPLADAAPVGQVDVHLFLFGVEGGSDVLFVVVVHDGFEVGGLELLLVGVGDGSVGEGVLIVGVGLVPFAGGGYFGGFGGLFVFRAFFAFRVFALFCLGIALRVSALFCLAVLRVGSLALVLVFLTVL